MKQRRFKKLVIALGAVGVITTTSVGFLIASCTTQKKQEPYKVMPTYTSQADTLLALGITPDYYPRLLNSKDNRPFAFLDPNSNEFKNNQVFDKPEFKAGLGNRLLDLESKIKTYNTTWWSFSGNQLGENVNEEHWRKHNGNLVYYDRYLFDNSHFEPQVVRRLSPDLNNGPFAKETYPVPVDFKASRDLFFSLSPEMIKTFTDENNKDPLAVGLRAGLKYKDESKGLLNPLFNYSYYAKRIQENYLNGETIDGINFKNSNFRKRVIEGNDVPLFYIEKDWQTKNSLNTIIYKQIEQLLLIKDIKKAGLTKLNYDPLNQKQKVSSELQHHPIYEQNLRKDGGTQLYLGTMRDGMFHLYDIAYATAKFAHTKEAEELFKNEPERLEMMKKALTHANEIAGNYNARIKAMREFLQAVGVVDKNYNPELKQFDNTNSINLGLLTISSKSGVSTLQSQSKFGFLYYDLGFKAPKPKLSDNLVNPLLEKVDGKQEGCHIHEDGTRHCPFGESTNGLPENYTGSIFNMDDNGWWWNLGENGLSEKNTARFNNQFDVVINIEFNPEGASLSNKDRTLVNKLFKEEHLSNNNLNSPSKKLFRDNYELWNEGVKSPIGLNLILDNLLKYILKYVGDDKKQQFAELYQKANSWGSYWEKFAKVNK
ncbi:iron ABC transporter substrate-binding protein [Ureaplasma diversum]|uniref:iron ABC transporter substrate-binding protein n=1 Tax=Ureaplasma diversum TaxID=42094 RepID=UPI000AE0874C|nr:iron ABC transporter substrate-binding protein [Ureaplasma diversum]